MITGAGGQLGRALVEEFPDAVGFTHADWDVTFPPPASAQSPALVLHAAAWTDVDGAEADPQGAAAVNVGGTRHAADLGASLVYYSTDYVFDGRKSEPYLESDPPNPLSAYGRTKLYGEAAAGEQSWIVRNLAAATRELLERPFGVWHLASDGDATWAEFAEAIFEEAALDTRVRRISSDELGRSAPRPAYSVLRSEKDAPTLPHWREGLRECLERLA